MTTPWPTRDATALRAIVFCIVAAVTCLAAIWLYRIYEQHHISVPQPPHHPNYTKIGCPRIRAAVNNPLNAYPPPHVPASELAWFATNCKVKFKTGGTP